MYQPTTALRKIAALRKTTRVIQGGQGAGKTVGIEMILANHAQHKMDAEITIVQAELSKLKKTAVRDFIKIMKSMDLWDRNRWNKTESIYNFPGGGFIEFLGLDKADVGKGFRRDVVYFNEINKGGITLDTYIQFASRAKVVYVDFNPDRKFWLHEEIIPDPDTDFLILTYKDNEYLPESEVKSILKYREKGFHKWEGLTIKELFDEGDPETGRPSNIKSKYWANKWKVYGLGLIGALDGLVFDNWTEIDNIPPEAEYVGTGLDFGYSNDPTAITDVYKWNGKRILDEVCYKTGMVNSDIHRVLDTGVMRPFRELKPSTKNEYVTVMRKVDRTIWADSAEPKSIEEIFRMGSYIQGAAKGADSINYGIQIMQGEEYLVTKRSENLKTELGSYTWAKDRDGNTINKPIDSYNHAIDGIRYHEMEDLGGDEMFLF